MHCRDGFEQLEQINGSRMTTCPRCGAPVAQQLSAPSVGRSVSGLDDRAKSAGFHKLKKIGSGEYEKKY
jgi:predicted nucleic acid-binding Zn ribbon protein